MSTRKLPDKKYTIVSNTIADDKNVSFAAKGVYFYMLTKPEVWNFTARGISRSGGCGTRLVLKSLKTLEEAGYIHRTKRDHTGHFEYLMFNSPDEKAEYLKKDQEDIPSLTPFGLQDKNASRQKRLKLKQAHIVSTIPKVNTIEEVSTVINDSQGSSFIGEKENFSQEIPKNNPLDKFKVLKDEKFIAECKLKFPEIDINDEFENIQLRLEANGFKLGNGQKIIDLKAYTRNWLKNSRKFAEKFNKAPSNYKSSNAPKFSPGVDLSDLYT